MQHPPPTPLSINHHPSIRLQTRRSVDHHHHLQERYGIEDMSQVACDPWSIHLASPADREAAIVDQATGRQGRLIQTFLYWRREGGMACNHYAHPLDILPVVDLNSQTVVRVEGTERVPPPIPDTPVNYHRDLLKVNQP